MCLSMKSFQFSFMKTTYLLAAISALLFSCESDSEEQINTLGTGISFSLAEYLDPQQKNLTFKFLTEKDFPCINYRITHQVQQVGNTIAVELTGIEKADVCLEAIGPATAFIDMSNLAEGDYELIIKVGEAITNQGTLTVTPQSYQVSMEEPEALIIENTELLRIPANVIWGTVRYNTQQKVKGLYDHLISSLRGVGAADKRLSEGNYYYFEVDASGRIRPKNAALDMAEEPFLMEFSGGDDQIANVLGQIESLYGEEAIVRVYNAKGEEFKSGQSY